MLEFFTDARSFLAEPGLARVAFAVAAYLVFVAGVLLVAYFHLSRLRRRPLHRWRPPVKGSHEL